MILLLMLVQLLAHPQFRVREAAQAVLTPANDLTVTLLERWEGLHHHLEGRRRCGCLVQRWERAQYAGQMPWMHDSVRGYVRLLETAGARVGRFGNPTWLHYSEATRLWVQEQVDARLPYRETLRRLWLLEWEWRWRNEAYPWCW